MSRTNRVHAAPAGRAPKTPLSKTDDVPEEVRSSARRHREMQISEIIEARAARTEFLNADIFHDPAWDMLLALFSACLGGQPISVRRLSLIARVPTSTAIRYLKCLSELHLLVQEGAGQHDEQANVRLTNYGRAAMESYFDYLNSGKFPEVISASKH